jgi:hypothetical protein
VKDNDEVISVLEDAGIPRERIMADDSFETTTDGVYAIGDVSGPPIQLDELLYQPDHSIIQQSIDAREREEPLNGDGWGVGWYDPSLSPEPAVYREVRPAWNDGNMRQLSPLVEDDRVWRPVPRNHLVTVAPDDTTATEPLALDVPAG